MEKNIGYNDRMTRAAFAMLIGLLCLTQVVTGTLAINLLLIAELLLLTSSLSYCPVYKVVKVISYKK